MKINDLIELYDTTYQDLVYRLAEKDFNSLDDLCVLSHESEEEISKALFNLARKNYNDESFLIKFIDEDLINAHKKILKERYNDDIYYRDMQSSLDKEHSESMSL